MKRIIPFALLLIALAAASNGVEGQEKKEKPGNKALPEDYLKLAKLKNYTGKVSVGPKSVSFKIDDTAYRTELKAAAALPTLPLQKVAIQKVDQKYAGSKWALGKEFELDFAEKVVLRKKNIMFEYDAKGFPIVSKLTPNAGGIPGYPAKIEDFSTDSIATVTFGPLKEGKPTVTMIYVDNK